MFMYPFQGMGDLWGFPFPGWRFADSGLAYLSPSGKHFRSLQDRLRPDDRAQLSEQDTTSDYIRKGNYEKNLSTRQKLTIEWTS